MVFKDYKTFAEWGFRFRFFYGLCRGVLSQAFVNNWINGSLYMFPIQVDTYYDKNNQPKTPIFCNTLAYFDKETNNFYYRSSPWNGSNFIGKNPPAINPLVPDVFKVFPGYGYNKKQIQFPTTIVDLGPRDYFINQICCSGGDGGFGSGCLG